VVDACDLRSGDEIFVMIAPREHHEGRDRAREARNHHPPDVPDQGKAGDDGEKYDEANAIMREAEEKISSAQGKTS